jgi:hypothetical protein
MNAQVALKCRCFLSTLPVWVCGRSPLQGTLWAHVQHALRGERALVTIDRTTSPHSTSCSTPAHPWLCTQQPVTPLANACLCALHMPGLLTPIRLHCTWACCCRPAAVGALLVACGSDPFHLVDAGVAAAAALSGGAAPRSIKQLPSSLDGFGW